jgi:uncharacterized protein (DUF433 family)/DNA-binding transcriptional MerR regulator
MQPTGAYSADRASALSGVPRSTIHYWSRHDLLVPGVSTEKVKLWSHADLMGLRIIYWLRQRKTSDAGAEVPRTSMRAIRRALGRLRELDAPLWELEQASVWVDGKGDIHVKGPGGPETLAGQMVVADAINLIAPFSTREGLSGPDLVRPRPELRIVPGRLSGSPHVVDTRLETRALYALDRDGLDSSAIRTLYPYVTAKQIAEALDLERQLEANLAIRDAA